MYTLITWFVLSLTTALLYVYWNLKKSHTYFRNASIPTTSPFLALYGLKDSIWMSKPLDEALADAYRTFDPHPVFGTYNLFSRSVLIRDPDLIRRILIKDFHYFQNHGTPVPEKFEPLTRQLFNLEGDEWKTLRMKMTGTFTSGKMKMMFPILQKCAEEMKSVLMKSIANPDGFHAKDLSSRYTTDVIGNCVFGLDTNSLQNPDTEFRKMGKRIFEYRWRILLRILFPKMPAWFIQYFGMEFFTKDVANYFMKLIKDMVKYREENNITRGDFLDLLIAMKNDTQNEKLKDEQEAADLAKFMAQVSENRIKCDVENTVELMAAQCFLFFVAGFEGNSHALMFLLFELAQNPKVQHKVREEVVSAIENNGGQITYDLLKNLPYLNMVLLETMRLHAPNGGVLARKCNENYKIPESDTVIPKGIRVVIPLQGLHSDEKYYEKPDEFYPEHFTKEAISKRHHFAYLPFGEGPRACIGNFFASIFECLINFGRPEKGILLYVLLLAERFANMQILAAAVHLIKDFFFEVSPKTIVPLEYLPSLGIPPVKGGIWLKCKPL